MLGADGGAHLAATSATWISQTASGAIRGARRAAGGGRLRLVRASFYRRTRATRSTADAEIAAGLWEPPCRPPGLRRIGLEALDILRVEKGYLTGSELNGQVTPLDAGLGALLRAGKDGAVRAGVGRALLGRKGLLVQERPALVGLRAADGRSRTLGGAQVTAGDDDRRSLGYVDLVGVQPGARRVDRARARGAQPRRSRYRARRARPAARR